MADQEKVELTISAVLDGGSINDLTKELTSGVEKATTEGGKRAQKQYAEFIAAAVDAGVRSVEDSRTVKGLSKKLANAEAMQKAIVEAYANGEKEHAKMLERKRKKEFAHLKQIADRRKSALAEYSRLQQRSFDQVADDFNDKLSSGISNLFSGNIDPGKIVKGLGKAVQQRGDAAVQKGKMADASQMTRFMGAMGKYTAMLGTFAMGMGATIGVIVMLVKAFIDLNDRIVEMNQGLVGTAGAADLGLGTAAVRAGQFQSKLDQIRGDVLDFSSRVDDDAWFVSSKDMMQILSGMNEMNYRFKDMEENIKNNVNGLSSFADHAIMAVAYGKLLGVEGAQMGQNMAQMANEFGVGLEVIAEGLHLVNKEAQMSGFSTKRFYSTILEVTSGMGQYNVRLQEAAGLLSSMGAAMGEARGEKLFKEIAGDTSFQGKSPVDALKDILIKGGPGKLKDIFADEARAKAADLFKAMDEEQRKRFATKFGLDASSAQAFGRSFAKAGLGGKEVSDYLSEIKASGEAAGFGEQAVRLSKAGRGDLDRMATAFGDLGAASRMRMMMRLPAFSGQKDLATAMQNATLTELQAISEATGMSLDQMKQMGFYQLRLQSEFKKLREDGATKAVGETIERGEFGTFRKVGEGMFEKVAVDPITGELEVLSGQFKDVDSYMDAQNDYLEQNTKVVNEDLEAAKKMSRETEKMANALEDNIAKILHDIYLAVRDILNWITGSKKKRDQLGRAGTKLREEFAGKEKGAKEALAAAKAAHEKSPTPTSAKAVASAEKEVASYGALREAATSLDPASYDTYEDYKAAVYKRAGVERPGSKAPGGGAKKSHGQKRREKEARGKTMGEAYKDEGWEGLASWLAGMESGIKSYHQFKGYMNDFFLNSGMSKKEQDAFMDYWTQSYLSNIKTQNPWIARERYTDNDLLVGRYLGLDKFMAAWTTTMNEGGVGGLMGDLNTLGDGPAAWDPMLNTYKDFLSFVMPNKYDEDMPTPNYGGGPVIPYATANDMYVPSNGRPVMLNSADSVLATMKGGAVDRAMGRGGSGGNVTIVVKNYGNPREVQEAVMRGIKIARGEPFV